GCGESPCPGLDIPWKERREDLAGKVADVGWTVRLQRAALGAFRRNSQPPTDFRTAGLRPRTGSSGGRSAIIRPTWYRNPTGGGAVRFRYLKPQRKRHDCSPEAA